jgi:hypothetical protein
MASKLGDFFVGISARPETKGIATFGASLGKLSLIAGGVATAIAGIGTAGIKIIGGTAKETAELSRQAKDLGVNVGGLDKLIKMFKYAGGSGEEAISVINTLHHKIGMFKYGEYDELGLGAMLGIAPQEFTDNFMENIELIRQRMKTIAPQEKKLFLDQSGFGEAIRLIRLTDKEYASYGKRAEQTGLINKKMSEDAERYARNMVDIALSWQQLKRELTTSTLPAFNKATEDLMKMFADESFKSNLSSFFNTLTSNLPKTIVLLEKTVSLIGKMIAPFTRTDDDTQKFIEEFQEENKYAGGGWGRLKRAGKYLFSSTEEQRGGLSFGEYVGMKGQGTQSVDNSVVNITPNIVVNAKTDASAEDIARVSADEFRKMIDGTFQDLRRGKVV